MRCRTALLPSLVIVFSGLVIAQEQEFARLLRSGDEATLSVFSGRPLDSAVEALAREFGIQVNVEDRSTSIGMMWKM